MIEPTGYRFAPLLLTAGQLGEAYDIANLARQSDQPGTLDWEVLGDNDVFEVFASIVDDFAGHRGGYGGHEFEWEFLVSPRMADYLRRQWFGKTDNSEGRLWTDCTARTFDATYGSEWRYVRAICRWATRQERRREGDLFIIKLTFIEGSKAPFGADLTIDAETDVDPTTTDNSIITVTVSNEGDYGTTAPVVVLYHLPALLDYVDVTAGMGWALEYSTDGTVWDDEEPVDPADVRHLRATRAATLAEQTDAPAIELTVIASATGEAESLWTVSMIGEFNPDNNSHTDDYEIVA